MSEELTKYEVADIIRNHLASLELKQHLLRRIYNDLMLYDLMLYDKITPELAMLRIEEATQ